MNQKRLSALFVMWYLLLGLLFTACRAAENPASESNAIPDENRQGLVERLRSQGELLENQPVVIARSPQPLTAIDIAARIRFQDRQDQPWKRQPEPASGSEMTMADRHIFHDRLWEAHSGYAAGR